jgi:hypothetical protein
VIVWYVGTNDLDEHVPRPFMADVVCHLKTQIPIYLGTVCHNPDHMMNKQVMQEDVYDMRNACSPHTDWRTITAFTLNTQGLTLD